MPKGPSLSMSDIIKVADLVRAHCRSINDEAVYDPEWSDKRIANESGISIATARNIRSNLLGKLKHAEKPPPLEDTLADLERRISALEQWQLENHGGGSKS